MGGLMRQPTAAAPRVRAQRLRMDAGFASPMMERQTYADFDRIQSRPLRGGGMRAFDTEEFMSAQPLRAQFSGGQVRAH